MKRFLLSIIIIISSISTFAAQSEVKSLRTLKYDLGKDTVSNGPALSKEIITIKGAVPKRQRGTLALLKAKIGKSDNNSTTKREPWEEVEPEDPVDPTDPPGPEGPVGNGVAIDAGRTPATLDVSASGGATFTVPITLPPGIGKMVPQIALSYNSQSDKGIAGLGWGISGLSSITRISTTQFHDGRIDGVNYDNNDRFALDGQRLLLKSGTYGMDGAEYQTENYSNTRIISHGSSPFGNNNGPEYFEVITADGSKSFYGSSTDSRSPNQYALTYTENPLGARMKYTYNNTGNSLLITQIEYGSIGAASGINQIIFTYGNSSRSEQGFIAGTSFFQNQLLTKISVYGSAGSYRHYRLDHTYIPTLNYQRLTSVQEFDGNEQHAFQPIQFSYNNTGDIITTSSISNLSVSGIASNNSEIITADFTGNGSMDFLVYPKYGKDKFWTFYDVEANSPYYQMGTQINIGPFIELFPVTELTYNDKILAGQNIAVVKSQGSSYKFDIYAAVAYSPTLHQYSKTWDNVPMGPMFYSTCDNTDKQYPLDFQFLSGDFNGDGMTDVIAINYGSVITYENAQATDDPYYNPGNCDQGTSDIGSTAYLIDLDRRLISNFVTNLGMLAASCDSSGKLMTGDFNGDGKTDILQIRNGWMYVYGLDSNGSLQLIWSVNDYRINNGQLFLPGDYNGDGKLDLMMATGNNSYFITFMSTGKSFVTHEQNQPFSNTAGSWNGNSPGTLTLNYLIPNDVDGDGKTDIVYAQTTTTNNSDQGYIFIYVYNAGSPSNSSQPSFSFQSFAGSYGALKHYPIPIFLNPNKPNLKLELGFMSNNNVSLFKFGRDFRTESQLSSIVQDGIQHTIEYKNLDNEQLYTNGISLYQSSLDQTYPYVDLQTIPGLSVVSRINRYYQNEQLTQLFGYGKAVSHAGGLGFLGFGELTRSNWFNGSSDVNRNFTTGIYDPQLRGALVRTFVSRAGYINPSIKNMSLSNPPPSTGLSDGASLNDYISRSDQAYTTELLANKVFINAVAASSTKEMLTGVFSTETVEYDNYFNPVKTSTNINGEAAKIVEASYQNNPAGNYLGRLLTSKITMSNGSGSFSNEEEYTYTGFLPSQIRKRGNGTGWLTENMVYDGFGNILQKTTTAPGGAQRTLSSIYDPTGRFVIGATDVEGQTASAVFNQVTGNRDSVTTTLGQTESYSYDTWGRLINTKDYLGVNASRTYEPDGYHIRITDADDEGHITITTTNPLGQTLEIKEKNITGQYIGKAATFDIYGRQTGVSEPAQPGSYSQWNTTLYDEYGRTMQSNSYTGKVTSMSYNGTSVTVNDGVKNVTTIKNALGQVVSLQDPGGTINYTYFPNGNLQSANYGGISQVIEQDGWGRKTKLTDPSAGIYQYEYDDWGQLTKEINPKGFTEYTYDGAGKIMQKKIVGDQTDMQYSYTYDPLSKLLTSMVLSNADGNNTIYTYTYDNVKRLTSTIEDNLHARFVKSYSYDSYGRIASEFFEAKDKYSNTSVQKGIDMLYQNGELLQTSLQGSGQIIWKVNNLDSKGKVSEAIQGPLKNIYQYDTYGLLQQSTLDNVSGSPSNLMTIGYGFDSQRGVLNNRSNSAFNWNENFSYDSQDRLTNFNDNLGNNSQTYDSRGRIQNNSQLGDYTYDGVNYRQTELNLQNNPVSNTYYQQQHALQQISYNAFKAPVEIFEQGIERISFQYNGAQGRAHMYYGDEQADKMSRRFRKHYSETGDMEITTDMVSGKTSFVFYLAGDPYTAPAIWKEEYQSGQSTQNLYYLHRDHLGSIVMITNGQGNVVEKRQFDAWGNIVMLQDGLGNNLAAFGIIDRGYTGHEHLLGVGLIHMNGRLYDPRLHRFLSPDNFIQDLFNTQNFNRFGYAMNNPLMFIDQGGEFIWAFVAIGALIGALTGGVSYVAQAIRTGDWSWKGLGMSMLTGAIIGGITGGVNPAGALTNLASWPLTLAGAFASGIVPPLNGNIGKFSFSLSPSFSFGKTFGIGANLSASYGSKFRISGGLGFMYYGNYQGFGMQGTEIRKSLMAAYDNGDFGISLGTNNWKGSDDMQEFDQKTGSIGLHIGEFKAFYENDGSIGKLGDDGDRYRTAALQVSIGKLDFAFSLITGSRDYNKESGSVLREDGTINKHRDPLCIDDFGRRMPNGLARELGTRYRMGALTIGYGNYRFGVDSEHIRHAIQDQAIHNLRIPWFNGKALIDKRQMGFENQSWQWLGFGQYRTRNSFTTW